MAAPDPPLEVPHPTVDDNKQTLNLARLKAWEVLLQASLATMQAEIDALIPGTVVAAIGARSARAWSARAWAKLTRVVDAEVEPGTRPRTLR